MKWSIFSFLEVSNPGLNCSITLMSYRIFCRSKLQNFLFNLICSHSCLATRWFNSFPCATRGLLSRIILLNRESIRYFLGFLIFLWNRNILWLHLRIEIRLLILNWIMWLMIRQLMRISFFSIRNIVMCPMRILRISTLFWYVSCRSNIFN